MSDNVKEKPKIEDDLEKRKIIDSENKDNCISKLVSNKQEEFILGKENQMYKN